MITESYEHEKIADLKAQVLKDAARIAELEAELHARTEVKINEEKK
jgi:hypothetical protein